MLWCIHILLYCISILQYSTITIIIITTATLLQLKMTINTLQSALAKT